MVRVFHMVLMFHLVQYGSIVGFLTWFTDCFLYVVFPFTSLPSSTMSKSEEEMFFESVKNDHPDTPLWRFLWTPDGFEYSSFQQNLKRCFPHEELLENTKKYFSGTRWVESEITQECKVLFEYLMLDYRSIPCFLHSRQIEEYAKNNYSIDLCEIFDEWTSSPLRNDTSFDWVDTKKTIMGIIGSVPVGSDPVLFALYSVLNPCDEVFCTSYPELFNVYFHGEDCEDYRHTPHREYNKTNIHYIRDDFVPILTSMALQGDLDIRNHKWSSHAIDKAVEYIKDELSDMESSLLETDSSEYSKMLLEDTRPLKKGLETLESLDDSWDPEIHRIGKMNTSLVRKLDTEIQMAESGLKLLTGFDASNRRVDISSCRCGNPFARECDMQLCATCCPGCARHTKKRKKMRGLK